MEKNVTFVCSTTTLAYMLYLISSEYIFLRILSLAIIITLNSYVWIMFILTIIGSVSYKIKDFFYKILMFLKKKKPKLFEGVSMNFRKDMKIVKYWYSV